MNLKIRLAAIVATILLFFGITYALSSVHAASRLVVAVPLISAGVGIVYYIARKYMPARPTARAHTKAKGILLGTVGGIIGALFGGLIIDVALLTSDILYFFSIIVSASIAASIFGRLTDGDRTTRGLIGCALALIAIMSGYLFLYVTPFNLNGDIAAPYEVGPFLEFLGFILEPIDYLLWLCGIGVGFLQGGRFLESRVRKNSSN